MKFVVSTQELNNLISKCINIVSIKTPIPILSNFLIQASNNQLTITSTDLVVGIRCQIEAKVLEEGATALPARRLAQLVRELTAPSLEISTNTNEVTEIKAGSSRFKLHGMSKTEFPALPTLEGSIHFILNQASLKDVFFRTAFAVSREDNRYVLTGVLLQIANGQATFVGTDGKRLSKAFLPIGLDSTYQGNFIIPFKAVEEIAKNLSEEGEVHIYLMSDKIALEMEGVTLVSKLLSGEYPDVNRIIPEKSDVVVSLHREELTTLLRQISLFTDEKNHSVRFTFMNGELELTANTRDVGEGKVSMPANYQGSKFEIAFNPNFFLDILKHSKAEAVSMAITDPFNPGIITDNDSSLFVLMPMRLNEE